MNTAAQRESSASDSATMRSAATQGTTLLAADRVRIGVTGHRALADIPALARAADEALQAIADRFRSRRFEVMSALAEGADRLLAERALGVDSGRDIQLIVPLPLPVDEYARSFGGQESREAFERLVRQAHEVIILTAAGTPARRGYRAVADFILSRADVLIAFWDGQAPTNEVGTAAVVSRARSRALPLVWIRARRSDAVRSRVSGKEPGSLVLERF